VKRKDSFALFVIALTLSAFVTAVEAYAAKNNPASQKAVRTRVKVYFADEAEDATDLKFVWRSVKTNSPARAALEALLAGPTPEEASKGYGGLIGAEEFGIGSLKIRNGTARVNFVSSRTWAGWSGDLSAHWFRKAVELTLRQFPTVRRVIVSLNGDPDLATLRQ
jgi:spore germination protein GerM